MYHSDVLQITTKTKLETVSIAKLLQAGMMVLMNIPSHLNIGV